MHSIRKTCLLHVSVRAFAVASLAGMAAAAQASLAISSGATKNVTCSGGVCTPTAINVVLNAGDLATMLASGNVTVTTTGTGVQADDIDVSAPVAWSTSGTLSLDAYRSIAVYKPVSVNGLSGVSLITNDGGKNGSLWFAQNGHIAFKNLSSQLSINRANFTLVGDIKTLASDVGANPTGDFALGKSYNAKNDGTYSASPIGPFGGIFSGLGNTVSNLSISDTTTSDLVGFFHQVWAGGTVENLSLANVKIAGPTGTSTATSWVGALVGFSGGLLFNDSTSGKVSSDIHGEYSNVGGLVGQTGPYQQYVPVIKNCFSTAEVSVGMIGSAGGLVGAQFGTTTSESYATGAVSQAGSGNGGGLVGYSGAYNGVGSSVINSYATGDVTVGSYANAGGLIGYNNSDSLISYSYSAGAATGTQSALGGLIGYDVSKSGSLKDTYWDTTTSGITNLSQGAGNIANDPRITGLSNKKLQSRLPKGFSKKIWDESGVLNDGLPYLVANPPPG